MKTSNRNILNLLSFFALVIAGLLILVTNLLPICGVKIGGPLISILSIIKELFIVIVVGISAYKFVSDKSKAWKIIFWIAIAIFVAGIVMIWFSNN